MRWLGFAKVHSIAMVTCLAAQMGHGQRLGGCQDSATLARAFGKLPDWDSLTGKTLERLWPRELSSRCQTKGVCRLLVSEDRIIGGKIQCEVAFTFVKGDQTSTSDISELSDIDLDYSATSHRRAIKNAKTLVMSFGVDPKEARKIDAGKNESIDWPVGRQHRVMDVLFTHTKTVWHVHIGVTRYPEHQSGR